ncbi:MAG TPA: HDOD domain-containing protein [Polyangiaceae bacterium]|nr:HDOD domain-containing protein [Polyangiaceae bacterium]
MPAPAHLLPALETLISSGDFVVPPYPAAALRLRRLVEADDFSLVEVTDAVSTDPALAAALLRLANSGAYASGSIPITTVGRAVHRVGARAVASLALATATAAAACAPGPLIDLKYRVWRRSLSCALACQALAPRRTLDAQEAFLAGLLHGFGRSVVVGCLERVLPSKPVAEARPLLDWLAAVEPHRHTLALKVAQAWKLPPELVRAVAGQSAPNAAAAEPMTWLVDLADRIGGALDRGETAEQVAATPGIRDDERKLITDFALSLPLSLDALLNPPDARELSKRPRAMSAVSKPPSSFAGELRPLKLPVFDVRNRKQPRPMQCTAATPDGLVLLGPDPMQESCVVRLSIGNPPEAVEGWFSVALCLPERELFRIEVQAFAASRELKETLTRLWTSARDR